LASTIDVGDAGAEPAVVVCVVDVDCVPVGVTVAVGIPPPQGSPEHVTLPPRRSKVVEERYSGAPASAAGDESSRTMTVTTLTAPSATVPLPSVHVGDPVDPESVCVEGFEHAHVTYVSMR